MGDDRTAEGGVVTGATRSAWERLPTDPDPAEDLGYPNEPLLVIDAPERGDQRIFLPAEEEQLLDDEFIVADGDSIVSLDELR
jgi:hypothetical protein